MADKHFIADTTFLLTFESSCCFNLGNPDFLINYHHKCRECTGVILLSVNLFLSRPFEN